MPDKQKIVLNKNSHYQFAHLLKHFQTAIKDASEYLEIIDVFNVLVAMGFLPEQYSEQDYELVHTITHMLAYPKNQGTITQRNLFRFLMALTQTTGRPDSYFQHPVQPLPKDTIPLEQPIVKINFGTFNQDGRWIVTNNEENQLRQVFKRMIYTRVSRNNYDSLGKNRQEEQLHHQPTILGRSAAIAKKMFRREGHPCRVQDRLLWAKKATESRIEYEVQQKQEKQLENCSFKPKINSFTFSLEKQNMQAMNRSQLLLFKGRQYDLKLKMKMQQKQQKIQKLNESCCSFYPDLSESRQSLRLSMKRSRVSSVKNEELTVSRLRIGREERERVNTVMARGYPAGVSWVKFMDEKKKSIPTTHASSLVQYAPSITLNLSSLSDNLMLQVRTGESLQEVANIVSRRYNISNHQKGNLFNLVRSSINNSRQAVVRNGRVYLRQ